MSAQYIIRLGVCDEQGRPIARVGIVGPSVFLAVGDANWVEELYEDDGPMWNVRRLSTAEARALAVALTCVADELSAVSPTHREAPQ